MRRFILFGVALIASALMPAGGSAHTAQTAISISAQTANKPVGSLVWATYGKTATISGTTADGQAGTTVELQKSAFPFSSAFTTIGQAQTGDGGAFTFTAKPTVATHYRVVLAADATSQSSVVTVYVAPHWINLPSGSCAGLSCHRHFANTIVYPPAAAKREGAKRVYFYFAVRYGSQTIPPSRTRLVKTGRQSSLGGDRYRAGFSVTFPTVKAYYFLWDICTKDTEARDGLGLPGHHHCGGRSIPYSAIQQGYLG